MIPTRRPLPFSVPPSLFQHPDAGPHLKSYDDLVVRREAHVAVLEKDLLETRDHLVRLLGAAHVQVTRLNDVIARQGALWHT